MDNVLEILNQIKNTSSKNEKESILKEHKDNKLLTEVLYFVFNPFIVTGLSSKKINKKFTIKGFTVINNLIDYLLEHNTGADLDIISVQIFIGKQPKNLQGLYTQIATKDLKIGITSKTINKAFGENFIPEFNVMLAKKYEDHEKKIVGDFVITKKLDGSRIIVFKDNGKVTSFTRTGKPYIGLNEIEEEIKNLPLDNTVFDGELIADSDGSTGEIFTETIKKSKTKDENKTGLLFNIFDMLSVEEFKNGKSEYNAIDRKSHLSTVFDTYGNDLKYCVEVKPLYIGDDKSRIKEFQKYAIGQGWEGIMINLNKPYVNKRTDSLLKVKAMQSADLKIIGFEEGQGKYKDTLGNIIVDYKGNNVSVGSGFSDKDRDEIWNNQKKYLGRVCEIQYFEESKNSKDDSVSLRFPIFKILREIDKKVSYY